MTMANTYSLWLPTSRFVVEKILTLTLAIALPGTSFAFALCPDDSQRESNVVLVGSSWEGPDGRRLGVSMTNLGNETALMKICFQLGGPDGVKAEPFCSFRALIPENKGGFSHDHTGPGSSGWVLWRWVDIPDDDVFDGKFFDICAAGHPSWDGEPLFDASAEGSRTRVWWHDPGNPEVIRSDVRQRGWPALELRQGGRGLP